MMPKIIIVYVDNFTYLTHIYLLTLEQEDNVTVQFNPFHYRPRGKSSDLLSDHDEANSCSMKL